MHKINYIKENCIKCGICQNVCPLISCIKIDTDFSIDLSQCIFCGNCVENCPKNALYFTKEYELAVNNKEKLILKEDN